jgi:arylsulfatase A-like enzyme
MQQLGLSINNVDGVDVSPCLQNPACSLSRSLYWHFPAYITDPRFASGHSASPAAAIRQGDWKLIDNMETGTYALFNLHDDIAEQHDLYRTRPDKARELRDALLHWQAQEQAAMPAPNPAYHTLTGWPWLRHSLQQIWQRWTTRLTVWLVLRDTE